LIEKLHISDSKRNKTLNVSEHVHIHVLQHPTKLQPEIMNTETVETI